MDINMSLRDAEFKDDKPLQTVEKIRGILADNGIEVEEHWSQSGVPYCHSLRLTVNGTNFGVNGKGLTKEFACASAYGEMMERLQFGFFSNFGMQKDTVDTGRDRTFARVPLKEHMEENVRWYRALAGRLEEFIGVREDPCRLLDRYVDEEGLIKAFPYYDLTNNKPTYFPLGLHGLYTTNGAAAGNTMEEAVVQGISETVERNHQLKIIREGLSMPDVPEDVLKQYKTAYDIITYVRNCGFKVAIKDASLGTKYPVICAVFVNEKTGRYHTHFGAYPVFEIALARSLTETFQGRNIDNVAAFEEFHYDRSQAYAVNSLLEELVKGSAQKHIDFFVGPCKYSFNSQVGFKGKNNRELLMECIAYFRDLGLDVLVRDRSCLGFPSYQVVIPGYSEWAFHRLTGEGDDSAFQPTAIRLLRYPAKATKEELVQLAEYLNLQKQYGKMNMYRGKLFRKMAMLPVQIPDVLDERFMNGTMAYLYYAVGDYATTGTYLEQMVKDKTNKSAEYLICIKRYVKMKANGYSEEEIRRGLTFFHKQSTCEKLFACIAENKNPMEEYTLRCDNTCTAECMFYGLCKQKRTQELMDLIQSKTGEMKFEDLAARVQTFFAEGNEG